MRCSDGLGPHGLRSEIKGDGIDDCGKGKIERHRVGLYFLDTSLLNESDMREKRKKGLD